MTIICLKTYSWLTLLLLIILLFRLICLKRKEVLLLSLLSLVCGFVFHVIYDKESKLPEFDESVITVQTFPDTLKINGDLLSIEGKEKLTKEKIIVQYTLKDETEKNKFEQNTKTLLLTGIGTTQKIESARNLNGFDYSEYLNLTHVSQKIKIESLSEVKEAELNFFHPIAKIRELRLFFVMHNKERFQSLTASYMNALLFGYKENTPDNFQKTWQSLGVAHLFSLSGMHIYFFLFVFDFVLLSLKMTKEHLFRWSILFTVFLIIVTGAGPGMMRAGIQYIVKKCNQRFGVGLSPLDCWAFALLINCLFEPYVLLTVGGQLTYYLTFLIIFIQPLIRKLDTGFKKGLAFNLLLSWLSLPLIWYHFYEWNLLNFVLNLLLSPLLFSIIMPLLLGSFMLSFIAQNVTFTWLEKLLVYFQWIGKKGNEWSFFQQVPGFLPVLLLLVVIISQLFILIEWEKGNSLLTFKTLCLFSMTCFAPFWKFLNPTGMIAFVDIGQGDAIFVQLPFHQGNYLLDTGGKLDFEVEDWQKRADKRGADYTLIPFMKSKGVKYLDTVFISHAHEDHFGDLDRISDSIQVKNLYFGPGSYEQNNFKKMLNYVNLKNTNKKAINHQYSWKKSGLSLDCLYPFETGDGQNNDSLVLKLNVKNQDILLMGDLEAEGEDELLRDSTIDLKADILKVGHHGSKTSSQPGFLEAVQPDVGVISCGQNNRYQHPSPETLENLAEVETDIYRTDTDGMVYYTWQAFSNKLSQPKTVK